jgi:hypothetical protein
MMVVGAEIGYAAMTQVEGYTLRTCGADEPEKACSLPFGGMRTISRNQNFAIATVAIPDTAQRSPGAVFDGGCSFQKSTSLMNRPLVKNRGRHYLPDAPAGL